jgi:hypothetical protein
VVVAAALIAMQEDMNDAEGSAVSEQSSPAKKHPISPPIDVTAEATAPRDIMSERMTSMPLKASAGLAMISTTETTSPASSSMYSRTEGARVGRLSTKDVTADQSSYISSQTSVARPLITAGVLLSTISQINIPACSSLSLSSSTTSSGKPSTKLEMLGDGELEMLGDGELMIPWKISL